MNEAQPQREVNPSALLLEVQRKLQNCRSVRELSFTAVNEGYALLRFDQAILWRHEGGSRISIAAISGLAELNRDSPYALWLHRAVDYIETNLPGKAVAFAYESLPEDLREEGEEWVHEQLLHCQLIDPDGHVLGGMLFHRDKPFSEVEQAIGEWLAAGVAFALWAWRDSSRRMNRLFRSRTARYGLGALVVLLAAMSFVPVRLSVVAPAEITPERPIPITSPTDGVVARILVQPNQVVKAGEALVELDDTSIRNRLAVAGKAYDTAKADYQRAANKAFTDEASKSDLLVLDSRIREKGAEVAYLRELLARLRLSSPQGGVAIFNDAEEWRGRPVQPGERIMMIADPSLVGVTVYLPPEDAVVLERGADVSVFLNINPLSSLHAHIAQTSYETTVLPDNTLAYVVKAALELHDSDELPRLGQRGTARVNGPRVSLGHYLLRKPLLFIRKSFGI